MKSYHKTKSYEREKSLRRLTRRCQELLISSLLPKLDKMVPFYIPFMDYMDKIISRICPIMGDYLVPISIQVGSSLSPDIYQESITNIKIVSQLLIFVGSLKLESPQTHEFIGLHTSHLVFLLYKLSIDCKLAWF